MKVLTALGDYSCLKVRLHFTRDKWFYYTTVFVPGKSFNACQFDLPTFLNMKVLFWWLPLLWHSGLSGMLSQQGWCLVWQPCSTSSQHQTSIFRNVKIKCTLSPQLFRFRSKLPVVSSLTAMNLWDGVCMFFIYASFLEFILVNYLARWVQDPEQKKHNRDNAILDVSFSKEWRIHFNVSS